MAKGQQAYLCVSTNVVFVLLMFQTSCAHGFKTGKINVKAETPGLFACEAVLFDAPFRAIREVRVFASVSHLVESVTPRQGAGVWVESVNARGFTVCVLEFAEGSSGTTQIGWIAVEEATPGITLGTVSLDSWSTGTKCERVHFSQHFLMIPLVFVTARHQVLRRPQDAMALWVEDAHERNFKVCLRETKIFDGRHEDIKVEWLAFTSPPENFTHVDSIVFTKNSAFCKTINFSNTFYAPPTVIVTPQLNLSDSSASTGCNAVTAWVEYTTENRTTLCVRSSDNDAVSEGNIKLDYAVIGDLHPCLDVNCSYYAVCKALGPKDFRCLCLDECPFYQEPVCSSNGTTYDNKCFYEREVCEHRHNLSLNHPGSCEGFPFQRGRRRIKSIPSRSDSYCEVIQFRPYVFYPDKAILVQMTANHIDTADQSYIHDAVVSWVESVGYDSFTACVMMTGMREREWFSNVTVDWMAFQGAPVGGVAGEVRIARWWTGTTCETVNFPIGKFSVTPSVFVTSEHHIPGLKRDAASVWVEDSTQSSFKVCLRELQNYAGIHEDISINWLAFSELHEPLFSEHDSIYFVNGQPPPPGNNDAYCKDVTFRKSYTTIPTVLVTANHSSSGLNMDPVYNGISAWIEYINDTGFRTCVKELYNSRYDPVSITFTVLPDICDRGWSYYGGYCYFKSSACTSWLTAEANCTAVDSNLVTVHNQEENVYIQHRHKGEKSWIGLNDRSVEGSFVWTNRELSSYRFWASNQPNNFRDSDCVHTLGVAHGYKWNDVPCTDCHNFTCAKDYDECATDSDNCHPNADCHNTVGSYSCSCRSGYTGNGILCTDYDECATGSNSCSANAQCRNTVGSYSCSCNAGYTGDGIHCTDYDECATGSNSCSANAQCRNTVGSYSCSCNAGYTGDGIHCTVMVIRLVGGTRYSGRVEVYHSGVWGTVCDDSWDMSDADVVCRQLGFPRANAAPHSAAYGQGSGTIWLDDVNCLGLESSLTSCGHRGWGSHNCGHSEDASVECNT